jgi:hypothetical protein
MKKSILVLIASFCLISGSFAQLVIDWQKSLGGTATENAADIKATPDGGCIIVGASSSFDGDVTGNQGGISDGWIVKLDVNGDIEWERTVGGSAEDGLRGVALTADGGYIVVGNTSSDDGDVTGFHGGFLGNNIWVVKLDVLGNIEWNNCYGGTGSDFSRRISQASDGGYLITGNTSSQDGDVTGFHPGPNPFGLFQDIWVVKINSTGTIIWQKCLGGSKNEVAADFQETSDNGYIVSGTVWGSNDGDVIGNPDTVAAPNSSVFSVWIVKMDSLQNIEWQRTYGGTGWDDAVGTLIQENGGYTFLGLTASYDGDVIGYIGDSTSSGRNFWLVNLDAAGAIQWQACFGADSTFILNGAGLAKTQNGGYAMSSEISGSDSDFPGYHVDPLNPLSPDYALVVCDSARNVLWQHCYGSYLIDNPNSITITADGGIIIAGNSGGNNGDISGHHGPLNIDDIWVVKLVEVPAGLQNAVHPVHAFNVYPNPVSTNAKIAFYLRESHNVTVQIYDLTGKVTTTLLNENLSSGYHQVNWNCSSDGLQPVSTGVYTIRITAGEYTAYKKIAIIR